MPRPFPNARDGGGSTAQRSNDAIPSPATKLEELELLGIEPPANPLKHLFMFGMTGIRNSSQEMLVAPHAAAVLGRAGPLARDANRATDLSISR